MPDVQPAAEQTRTSHVHCYFCFLVIEIGEGWGARTAPIFHMTPMADGQLAAVPMQVPICERCNEQREAAAAEQQARSKLIVPSMQAPPL